MKLALALGSLLTFIGLNSVAANDELQDLRASTYADFPRCQGTVATSDKILAVGDENDLVRPQVYLTNLENWSNLGKLPVTGAIVDLKIQGDDLYILTSQIIEKWNLVTLQSEAAIKLPGNHKSATGFVVKEDVAFVSLGSQGISQLDLKTGKEIGRLNIAPNTSVTDLDFLDTENLILAVDDAAEGAFQGMVVVRLAPFKVVKQIPLRGAAAPLSVKVSGENVYLGLFPAIWKFNRFDLLGVKKVKSITRAWEFLGATGSSMVGKNFYDSRYMLTCVQEKNQFIPKAFKLSELNFK